MILELKFGSKWIVVELDEKVERLDVSLDPLVEQFVDVRQLVGQILAGPIKCKKDCQFYASGPSIDATLIVIDSQGSIVSDGEYVWRTIAH